MENVNKKRKTLTEYHTNLNLPLISVFMFENKVKHF